MNLANVVLVLAAAAAEPALVPTVQDDVARIEALVLAELQGEVALADTAPAAVRPAKVASGTTLPPPKDDQLIEFGALSGMLGKTVRFTTQTGHSHVAIVDAVSGNTVRLLVRLPGGQATYSLARGQIARITKV
jgi:hypothetical protein